MGKPITLQDFEDPKCVQSTLRKSFKVLYDYAFPNAEKHYYDHLQETGFFAEDHDPRFLENVPDITVMQTIAPVMMSDANIDIAFNQLICARPDAAQHPEDADIEPQLVVLSHLINYIKYVSMKANNYSMLVKEQADVLQEEEALVHEIASFDKELQRYMKEEEERMRRDLELQKETKTLEQELVDLQEDARKKQEKFNSTLEADSRVRQENDALQMQLDDLLRQLAETKADLLSNGENQLLENQRELEDTKICLEQEKQELSKLMETKKTLVSGLSERKEFLLKLQDEYCPLIDIIGREREHHNSLHCETEDLKDYVKCRKDRCEKLAAEIEHFKLRIPENETFLKSNLDDCEEEVREIEEMAENFKKDQAELIRQESDVRMEHDEALQEHREVLATSSSRNKQHLQRLDSQISRDFDFFNKLQQKISSLP